MERRRKDTLRLEEFDYSAPGAYFTTVCTAHRQCIFGEIREGTMLLSEAGRIVDECWQNLGVHFPGARSRSCQIMPNHVHGIIEIISQSHATRPDAGDPRLEPSLPVLKPDSCRGVQLNAPTSDQFSIISPKRGSLSLIVRTFKAAVTTQLRKRGNLGTTSIWQRGFHDRIIRDDTERYFIDRYISLNPLLWSLDRNNPDGQTLSVDEMRRMLREKSGLDEYAVERLLERRMV